MLDFKQFIAESTKSAKQEQQVIDNKDSSDLSKSISSGEKEKEDKEAVRDAEAENEKRNKDEKEKEDEE